MVCDLTPYAAKLGVTKIFPHQQEAVEMAEAMERTRVRICLYAKTGSGKTATAGLVLTVLGYDEALIIAPPITHPAWEKVGAQLGIKMQTISHAKFRMKNFKTSRQTPIVVDEFHLLGGHTGAGWKKMDRLAPGLQAPLIIASATPSYNDAERVYCVQHVMDPQSLRGGFPAFLYANCMTEPNFFGAIPIVKGFIHHKDAEHYLRSLPYVVNVPETVHIPIVDIMLTNMIGADFYSLNLNHRKKRIMASQIEARHAETFALRVKPSGGLHDNIMNELERLIGNASTPALLFCEHEKVAREVLFSCKENNANAVLVTGKTTKKKKLEIVETFKRGEIDILIGTSTLATGTDGLDKMCDLLVIIEDTPDDALRLQLIGRIRPRGEDVDVSRKGLYRINVAPDVKDLGVGSVIL